MNGSIAVHPDLDKYAFHRMSNISEIGYPNILNRICLNMKLTETISTKK